MDLPYIYIPIEILHLIASNHVHVYRVLLSLPYFARSMCACLRVDFMIKFGYSVSIQHNYTKWYLNKEIHRVDGPAIDYTDGHKEWRINGKLHRVDGPALIHADGSIYWYINGELQFNI